MSAEANTTSTSAAAPAPAASAQQQQSLTPQANPEAEGLLKQADMLKEQQTEAVKALEKERLEKEAMAKKLAYYEQKAAKEAEEYRVAQEPKYKEYIEELQVTAGKKLDEAKLKQYHTLFTNPQFKDDADVMFAQHKEMVELRASKKQHLEELAKERAEKAKLNETVSKASMQVNSMRKSYVEASAAAAGGAEERKQVSVSASLNANEIMCADPSVAELPFLQKYGYSNNVDVNASAASGPYGGVKPIRKSVIAAREHPLLYDEDGEMNFPNSARYHNPTFFAWMVNEAPLDKVDLSDYVSINASKSFIEPKRVDGDNF